MIELLGRTDAAGAVLFGEIGAGLLGVGTELLWFGAGDVVDVAISRMPFVVSLFIDNRVLRSTAPFDLIVKVIIPAASWIISIILLQNRTDEKQIRLLR